MNWWRHLRVAIVHYWFVGGGGGERVVEALCGLFPQADLFAIVADPATMTPQQRSHKLTTSFLQRVPGGVRWHRHFLPLHPLALEQFDLSGYDLVISSESGPAKGVITSSRTCHVCYCHSPMRYLWEMYPEYRRSLGPISSTIFSLSAHYVRMWDLAASARVDYFAANSKNVAARIRKHYRRESTVVHPPVAVSGGFVSHCSDDFYLLVGRLVDYKRADLAIKACKELKRRLRIIGDGSQLSQLRRIAGPNVEFLGRVDDDELSQNYAHCRALLFPGEEDFGIVPVEAQSFGRPVIAFGRGGVLETVVGIPENAGDPASSTGVFFVEQSVECLVDAILRFESIERHFSSEFIRSSALRFDLPRFESQMRSFVGDCLTDHYRLRVPPARIGSLVSK
jgi:glycosyltransferase involved in cell wall biosynthesis